jgi:hypothetical protein
MTVLRHIGALFYGAEAFALLISLAPSDAAVVAGGNQKETRPCRPSLATLQTGAMRVGVQRTALARAATSRLPLNELA